MNERVKRTAAGIAAIFVICGAVIFSAGTPSSRLSAENGQPDVVYWPTPQIVVDKMLETARVTKTDLIYELGCGDARALVTAAKRYGAHGIGFDVRPERVADSKENVKRNNVENLVQIRNQDIFTLDLSPANVIYLYLLPDLNVKLIPQLRRLRPGSRIVSHDFDMGGVKPKLVVHVTGPRDGGPDRQPTPGEPPKEHTIFLWETPLEME